MSKAGAYRGVYARRVTEVSKDEIRERQGDALEYSTGRKVRIACARFWQARGADEIQRAGGWAWGEDDVPRRWVSKKQEPLPPIASAPKETPYQEFKREAQERADAEAMQKHWDEEWEADMRQIERERSIKERRAAGLIRVRTNRRDAPQATPDPSTGQAEGTPPG
jgi:hypothetical protein